MQEGRPAQDNINYGNGGQGMAGHCSSGQGRAEQGRVLSACSSGNLRFMDTLSEPAQGKAGQGREGYRAPG